MALDDDSGMTSADDMEFGACAILANNQLSDCRLDGISLLHKAAPFRAPTGRETGMAATVHFTMFLLLLQLTRSPSAATTCARKTKTVTVGTTRKTAATCAAMRARIRSVLPAARCVRTLSAVLPLDSQGRSVNTNYRFPLLSRYEATRSNKMLISANTCTPCNLKRKLYRR
nr:uncharacterized protein LOC129384847 isoform X3 [Dermacentor andersoni]